MLPAGFFALSLGLLAWNAYDAWYWGVAVALLYLLILLPVNWAVLGFLLFGPKESDDRNLARWFQGVKWLLFVAFVTVIWLTTYQVHSVSGD